MAFEGEDFEVTVEGGLFNYSGLPLSQRKCFHEQQPQHVFGAIMIVLAVVGLIGNTLVFSTILILREYKKSVTNWYILQLSLADTLFLLTLPITAVSEIQGVWNFSTSLCKFKEAVLFINYYASIYFLVIMSFDRYLAVTKALASKSWVTSLRSPLASYLISLFGWILSVLLCIQLYQYSSISECNVCAYHFPPDHTNDIILTERQEVNATVDNTTTETVEIPKTIDIYDIYANGYENVGEETLVDILETYFSNFGGAEDFNIVEAFNTTDNGTWNTTDNGTREMEHYRQWNTNDTTVFENMCRLPESQTLLIWIYGNFIGAFCLPFLLICFFYAMIMMTIMQAGTVGNVDRQRSYRRRVTMIVLALVTLFGVSWLPWYIVNLVRINGLDLHEQDCLTLRNAVRGIAYLSSALNPYFYSFLGTHFRDRLMKAGNRVRLPTSFRSRNGTLVGNRRHRYSTSNSGSNRGNNVEMRNGNGNAQQREQHRSSLQRTERTLQPTKNNVEKFSNVVKVHAEPQG